MDICWDSRDGQTPQSQGHQGSLRPNYHSLIIIIVLLIKNFLKYSHNNFMLEINSGLVDLKEIKTVSLTKSVKLFLSEINILILKLISDFQICYLLGCWND